MEALSFPLLFISSPSLRLHWPLSPTTNMLAYSLQHRPAVPNISMSKIIFNYFILLLRFQISDFFQVNFTAVFPNSKLVVNEEENEDDMTCTFWEPSALLCHFHIVMLNIFTSDLLWWEITKSHNKLM